MIKLIAADFLNDREIRLRFSDGSAGTYDFGNFQMAGTPMTEPLLDPEFFRRAYIALGAICWPNGFDLSAQALHRALDEGGRLSRSSAAA